MKFTEMQARVVQEMNRITEPEFKDVSPDARRNLTAQIADLQKKKTMTASDVVRLAVFKLLVCPPNDENLRETAMDAIIGVMAGLAAKQKIPPGDAAIRCIEIDDANDAASQRIVKLEQQVAEAAQQHLTISKMVQSLEEQLALKKTECETLLEQKEQIEDQLLDLRTKPTPAADPAVSQEKSQLTARVVKLEAELKSANDRLALQLQHPEAAESLNSDTVAGLDSLITALESSDSKYSKYLFELLRLKISNIPVHG